MKVGDRVVLVKPIEMFNKTYYPGHEFTIVRDDNMRGFDLKDDENNEICETRFASDCFISIAETRDRKIDQILKRGI